MNFATSDLVASSKRSQSLTFRIGGLPCLRDGTGADNRLKPMSGKPKLFRGVRISSAAPRAPPQREVHFPRKSQDRIAQHCSPEVVLCFRNGSSALLLCGAVALCRHQRKMECSTDRLNGMRHFSWCPKHVEILRQAPVLSRSKGESLETLLAGSSAALSISSSRFGSLCRLTGTQRVADRSAA